MQPIQLSVYIQEPVRKGGMASIEIPPDIADRLLPDGKSKERVVVIFDNGKKFHRALQRNKNGFCFIVLGKSTLKEAKKELSREEEITLEIDTSEFGMPMPEELSEVLKQDPEGESGFWG